MAVQFSYPSYINEFLILTHIICSVGKRLVYSHCKNWCVVCVLHMPGHVGVAWKVKKKTMQFWKSGCKFAFGRNQKGNVFGILRWKNWV